MVPDNRYVLRCDAKGALTQFTSIRLTMLAADFTELKADEKEVTSKVYEDYTSAVRAPGTAAKGAVTLYSEDTGFFDACSVVEEG